MFCIRRENIPTIKGKEIPKNKCLTTDTAPSYHPTPIEVLEGNASCSDSRKNKKNSSPYINQKQVDSEKRIQTKDDSKNFDEPREQNFTNISSPIADKQNSSSEGKIFI